MRVDIVDSGSYREKERLEWSSFSSGVVQVLM
jgi:hypothetical protein